jgi:signal transduction histidine kinase
VIVDITERRDLQAQVELARRQDQLNRRESKILQKRNEELETISRTKDEFVALASHQLRTPATAVKQYLGMVLQGYVGDISEIQTEMLHKAFESNERQIQIINQILNAARVDTGRLAMTTMPIDMVALVRGIADDMRPSLEQRGHTFTVILPKKPLHVLADIGYLRMAIENVLHNASVYTPEGGGVITLRLSQQDERVSMSVTDTGVGIKKADISKLFTKFSRIHNPLSVQAGGSGIGLYLTAEIVRLHGGTVTVQSKIKQGTTFAILLPLEHNSSKAERTNLSTSMFVSASARPENK